MGLESTFWVLYYQAKGDMSVFATLLGTFLLDGRQHTYEYTNTR